MANFPSDGTPDGSASGDPSQGIQSIHDTLTAAQVAAGAVITLPSGTFHWTKKLLITKVITLQGNGGPYATNSGSWATNVVDDVDIVPAQPLLTVRMTPGWRTYPPWDNSKAPVRITGINFVRGSRAKRAAQGGVQTEPYNTLACITFVGHDQRTDSQFRFDHCGFQFLNGEFDSSTVTGLIDHNYFMLFDGTTNVQNPIFYNRQEWWQMPDADNTVAPYSYNDPRHQWADGSASDVVRWGTTEFVYFEYNTIYGSIPNHNGLCDSFGGNRLVFRYNKIIDCSFQTHGTEGSGPGRGHGHRAWEIYGNNMVCRASYTNPAGPGTPNSAPLCLMRSGSATIFDNITNPANSTELPYTQPRLALQAYRYYLNAIGHGWNGADGTNDMDHNSGPYSTGTMLAGGLANNADVDVTVNIQQTGSIPQASWGNNTWQYYTIVNPDLPKLSSTQQHYAVINASSGSRLTLHAPFGGTGIPNHPLGVSWNSTVGFNYVIYKVDHAVDAPGWGAGALVHSQNNDNNNDIAVPPDSWVKTTDPHDKQDQINEKVYNWISSPAPANAMPLAVFPSFLPADHWSNTARPGYTPLGAHPLASPIVPTITDTGFTFNSDAASQSFTLNTSGFTNSGSITWAVPIVTQAPITPLGLPQNVIFTQATGTFSGTAFGATVGSYVMTLTANATGPTESATRNDFTLTVSAPHKGPTVTITAPSNNQAFLTPVDITLTANPLPGDNPIAKVEFYRGVTTLIDTATTSPWSVIWPAVPAGAYALTAKVYDTFNPVATATSTAVNITVTSPGLAAPTIAVSATGPAPPITPPAQTGIIWGNNKVNQITSMTGTPSIQRELTDIYATGGRVVRIDVDQANNRGDLAAIISYAQGLGITKFVLDYYADITWTGSPPSSSTFANGAVALAQAHPGPDFYIELSNEPNLHNISAANYATLAIAAYTALKNAGVTNTILLGGVGNSASVVGGLSMYYWCNALVTAGCTTGTGFDWANYHNYGTIANEPWWHVYTLQGSTGDVRTPANQSCQNRFGNPPFAMTEFGSGVTNDAGGSTATQATQMGDWMTSFKAAPDCRMAIQYAIADEATPSANHYGLRNIDLSHKPSWDVFLAQATS